MFIVYRPIFVFLEVSQDVVILVVLHDAKYGARVKVFQNRFVVVDHGHVRTTVIRSAKSTAHNDSRAAYDCHLYKEGRRIEN